MKIKVLLKKLIGCFILNPYYLLECALHPVEKGMVLFADGHQNHIPYSMVALRDELKQISDIHIVEYYRDYSFCGVLNGLQSMLGVIPLFARAEYVFLSDCYIPTAVCKKRKNTKLVQLWHSSGLLKKVGCDSEEETKNSIHGQFRNTDVFTASSSIVADVLSCALNIPRDRFPEIGTTRTDSLFNTKRTERLRDVFYKRYPQYKDKKIILWAPTFRGSAHNGSLVGLDNIEELRRALGDEYVIIIKTHRFANSKQYDTPVSFSADEIITFADLLITDYSSIYFDFLYFRRPAILFAPDYEIYSKNRGIYFDYTKLPGYHAYNYDELVSGIISASSWANDDYHRKQDALWNEQMVWCNGKSCDALLRNIGLKK